MNVKTQDGLAKRERRKQPRPSQLLDAALDPFAEKGFAGTRAKAQAGRAGGRP